MKRLRRRSTSGAPDAAGHGWVQVQTARGAGRLAGVERRLLARRIAGLAPSMPDVKVCDTYDLFSDGAGRQLQGMFIDGVYLTEKGFAQPGAAIAPLLPAAGEGRP